MVPPDARPVTLSSPDLLAALERTAARGRELTADLIALLAECDSRQLYAIEGYPSLFEFCVARLRLSESQAYHRIQAARAVRRFPLVLERLREGRVSLTAVALLREHLTQANHREVLDWAEGRRKREVEEFVRRLDPQPDAAASLRRLAPQPLPLSPAVAAERAPVLTVNLASFQASPASPGRVETTVSTPPAGATVPAEPCPARAEMRPTAPARYSLRVTISEETADKLRRAQALLGHALPNADPALVLDRALSLLVAQLERRKAGAPPKPARAAAPATPTKPVTTLPRASVLPKRTPLGAGPRHRQNASSDAARATAADGTAREAPGSTRHAPRSRYIPAAIRRAVWQRDGGCCAYVSSSGNRCTARAALEFHHRIPFAEGGASSVENLSLACVRHNALEAERWFNFDQTEFHGVGETRGGGA